MTGYTAGVRFPTGARDFSLVHSVQTGSATPSALYIMGTGGSLSVSVKRPGREADQSLPSSTEIKNGRAIPPLPIRVHGVVLN
jgi:hypothetical protein